MNFTLHVWRQGGPREPGRMVTYQARHVNPDMSFLEMLDAVHRGLVERGRARAFPVIKDLVVDRSALDRIIQAGGYVSVNTGGAPDGNALPIARATQEQAMD